VCSLGAGNAQGARLAFRVAFAVTVAIAAVAGSLLFGFRRRLIALFTTEPATVALGMKIMPIVALSLLGGFA
jgi:Na+-driven multidrug efflux pump